MKEIRSIVEAYRDMDKGSLKAAMATLVRIDGSSYRRTGARMLILSDGRYFGGISGGCLEGDALRRAQQAIFNNKPVLVTYDTSLDDQHQVGVGLGCNGIIDVLISPVDPLSENDPIRCLEEVLDSRSPKTIVSILINEAEPSSAGKSFLYNDPVSFISAFPLKENQVQMLEFINGCRAGKSSGTFESGTGINRAVIFIEVILPVNQLIIHGSNDDIYPVLAIAHEMDWNITVVTRLIKAGKPLFQFAGHVIDEKSVETPLVDEYSATLLMTHDYLSDLHLLIRYLQTPSRYIGILGPRKRMEKMISEIDSMGNPISASDKERIFAPAGLDIGANTPEEIALSVIAEIQARFAGKEGSSLRLKEGSIHGN